MEQGRQGRSRFLMERGRRSEKVGGRRVGRVDQRMERGERTAWRSNMRDQGRRDERSIDESGRT